MTAYQVGDLEIFYAASMEDYRGNGVPLVLRFGGKVLAPDSTPTALENWTSTNMLIVEFSDRQAIEDLSTSANTRRSPNSEEPPRDRG
jgi:uncharacterized protein (DUF1330 family)